MHAMQYEITLPADYDMKIIRERVATRDVLDLLRRLRPAIERELGAATAKRIFLTNPAHAFQADW